MKRIRITHILSWKDLNVFTDTEKCFAYGLMGIDRAYETGTLKPHLVK